ncbi:MAG: hypothetical protein FJ125_10065, partial [Deltaproteobacteria bacterium]|nr:hypothetical protein [Deltaproteobacteria bacterium]
MRCGGEMEPDSIYCSPCDAEVRNALAEMDAYRNRFETAKLLEGLHQEELISATLAQLTERGITTWHGLRNEWNGRAIDIVLAWSPGR